LQQQLQKLEDRVPAYILLLDLLQNHCR